MRNRLLSQCICSSAVSFTCIAPTKAIRRIGPRARSARVGHGGSLSSICMKVVQYQSISVQVPTLSEDICTRGSTCVGQPLFEGLKDHDDLVECDLNMAPQKYQYCSTHPVSEAPMPTSMPLSYVLLYEPVTSWERHLSRHAQSFGLASHA